MIIVAHVTDCIQDPHTLNILFVLITSVKQKTSIDLQFMNISQLQKSFYVHSVLEAVRAPPKHTAVFQLEVGLIGAYAVCGAVCYFYQTKSLLTPPITDSDSTLNTTQGPLGFGQTQIHFQCLVIISQACSLQEM